MPNAPSPDVAEAAAALARGDLVAFPTETVYGLGARADDADAVGRIFDAKGRPADHPLIVHVHSVHAAAPFAAAWPEPAQRLADRFWPGPLTVIVARRPGVATRAAGGHGSVGLRVPAHPMALALLRQAHALGVPGVAGPSANRFGRTSPTTAAHVWQELGGTPRLQVLDGGACTVGIESAIVDCTGPHPQLLRPGQIGRAQLEAALGRALGSTGPGAEGHLLDAASPNIGGALSTPAPGTLASHYAPTAKLLLLDEATLRARMHTQQRQGGPREGIGLYTPWAPPVGWLHRPMPLHADAAAQELFARLREFDDLGAHTVWVQQPPAGAAWDGVRDRLTRAAHCP